jgi:hypothetical protein
MQSFNVSQFGCKFNQLSSKLNRNAPSMMVFEKSAMKMCRIPMTHPVCVPLGDFIGRRNHVTGVPSHYPDACHMVFPANKIA